MEENDVSEEMFARIRNALVKISIITASALRQGGEVEIETQLRTKVAELEEELRLARMHEGVSVTKFTRFANHGEVSEYQDPLYGWKCECGNVFSWKNGLRTVTRNAPHYCRLPDEIHKLRNRIDLWVK